MMVASGFGICFIPGFSPTIPGVLTRVVADPEVVREVSLVSIAGRRFSPGGSPPSLAQSGGTSGSEEGSLSC
jgi:hypothetical protein